jgi:hypothetical protein
MLLRPNSEKGSVTAELAIALPAVTMVIAVTLAGFGLQVERMKFVSLASSSARAIGRGEAQARVEAEFEALASGAELSIEYLENHVCARIERTFRVAGIESFTVSEKQCSRKLGL